MTRDCPCGVSRARGSAAGGGGGRGVGPPHLEPEARHPPAGGARDAGWRRRRPRRAGRHHLRLPPPRHLPHHHSGAPPAPPPSLVVAAMHSSSPMLTDCRRGATHSLVCRHLLDQTLAVMSQHGELVSRLLVSASFLTDRDAAQPSCGPGTYRGCVI